MLSQQPELQIRTMESFPLLRYSHQVISVPFQQHRRTSRTKNDHQHRVQHYDDRHPFNRVIKKGIQQRCKLRQIFGFCFSIESSSQESNEYDCGSSNE